MSATWIAVPPEALRGEGLEPYPPGDIGGLFDWAENPQAGSTHLMPHAGEILLDIVDIEANAVHQPCKPDDEIVFVAAGTLRLTSDLDQSQLAVPAGEAVFIPRGWAGIYRADPADGRFIEVAVVPHDYFDPTLPRERSAATPTLVALPQEAGRHARSYGSYRLVVDDVEEQAATVCATDTLIRVLSGSLTLRDGDRRETLEAGRLAVLPKGFSGTLAGAPRARLLELSRPGAPAP